MNYAAEKGNCVYTYNEIFKIVDGSDTPTDNLSRSEILDIFYEEVLLNGNNSNIVYFDDNKYKRVLWV